MASLQHNWAPSPVAIFMFHGRCVGTIPLEFLESAQVNNWTFIRYVLSAIVCLPQVYTILNGEEAVSGSPEAIRYEIITDPGSAEVTFQQGPQGKSLSRAQRDTDSSSTVSASSRVTDCPSERDFREALVGRDGWCLVTGSIKYDTLTACHIVPQSLDQPYLDAITGIPNQIWVFSPQNGLLLNELLHKSFDKFRWGIYHDDGAYYIHSFESGSTDPTCSSSIMVAGCY